MTTRPYEIHDDTIHFTHGFCNSLDPYYKTINNYKVLSFDNRDELAHLNYFNKPIDFSNMPNVTTVIFGYYFNSPVQLTPTITSLTFWYNYNQIIIPTKNLTFVQFSNRYDHPFISPKNMITIIHSSDFNQPLLLSKNLHTLKTPWGYSQPIKLTKHVTIVKLVAMQKYDHPIELSKNTTDLTIYFEINQLIILPKHLKYFNIGTIRVKCKIIMNRELLYTCINRFTKQKCTLEHSPTDLIVGLIGEINLYDVHDLPNNVIKIIYSRNKNGDGLINKPSKTQCSKEKRPGKSEFL